MVSAVAVENVDVVNLVKIVLQSVSAEHLSNTGVEACAEEGSQACLFKLLLVSPLPAVVKVSCEALFPASLLVDGSPFGVVGVLGLVVCCINIVCTAFKAGVHNS